VNLQAYVVGVKRAVRVVSLTGPSGDT